MKKYEDFINESKLQLLLEAKMFYTHNFMTILNDIDHPIADEVKKLRGKEVDVNTNMIDIDYDKNDLISFIPDSKYEKLDYIISDPDRANNTLTIYLDLVDGYDFNRISNPEEGQIVTLYKDYTAEEISNALKKYDITTSIDYSHVKWVDRYGNNCSILYETDYLARNKGDIKPSPFKVGKFVRALLTKAGVEFTPPEIEAFVDKFKAEMMKRKDIFENNFDIVKGEDIRDFYLEDNYIDSDEGTLGGSCMKGAECQEYLNIYVENDSVSLIIFRSEEDRDRITGRAILWDARLEATGARIKFMDRVYVNKSNDIELFKQFAIKNGFYYKHKQDYSETPLMFNDEVLSDYNSQIYVDINPGNYVQYPYMDTVKYHLIDRGILKNFPPGVKRDSTDGECIYCHSTGVSSCYNCAGDGSVSCYNCDGDGDVECDYCDGDGYVYCNRCDGDGSYDCNNCSGSGEEDCEECAGSGEDSEGDTCSSCDGSGKVTCTECIDGNIECEECDGDGKNDCRRCDGDGRKECDSCDGSGNEECGECEGSGERECGECQ